MRAVNEAPLSLYLHIPFCDHRCAYCDFNAYAALESLIPSYTTALITELTLWGRLLGRRPLATVFFGGGTPSLLPPAMIEQIIDAIHQQFAVDAGAEWSLEANPGTVDQPYLRALRALGVNRLSLGVQSFDDDELRRLDRIHDAATAVRAYHDARAAGFDNVNLDLIFGLEGQDGGGWQMNLQRAVALAPEHLSLYALTVEQGTPLAHRVAHGQAPEPDEDLQADMYEAAQGSLAGAGYQQYEISNWAVAGRACRHNLVYWRDGEWLGLGAGAHAHLAGRRLASVRSPAAYIRRVRDAVVGESPWQDQLAAGAFGWIASAEAPRLDRDLADAIAMELRLSAGIDEARFAARWQRTFTEQFGPAVQELTAAGLLLTGDGAVRIPPERRFVAGAIIARLLAEIEPVTAAE